MQNFTTVDVTVEIVCIAVLLVLIVLAATAIVITLKQKRNYNKAKELIKTKEKHLKKEHKISSPFFNITIPHQLY